MNVRVPINGETLRWARVESMLDTAEVARAAGVRPERVSEFEQGGAQPTYTQMRNIAKKLDRPLGFFFAPAPAQSDVPKTADFRGRPDGDVPPALVKELRRALQHRRTLLDLTPKTESIPNIGRVTRQNVEAKALQLRQALGLSIGSRPLASGNSNTVFTYWRGLLEHHGYIVFQTTGVDLNTFRAVSIDEDPLPIILLNGADSAFAKVFSLFHEAAHIANGTSGLCLMNDRVAEEAVCNAFAAAFLMPAAAVDDFVQSRPNVTPNSVANQFKVSDVAAAIKLKTMGRLTQEDVDETAENSRAAWERARAQQASRDGFVPQWRLRYRDLGTTYLGTVFRAIEDERISYLDATYLLNAKIPAIEQMQAEFFRTGSAQ